jgi:hypothetical protein
MRLDTHQPGVNLPPYLHPYNGSSSTYSDLTKLNSTWVKLREAPSPYSHDEALLLCQQSDTEWVAWVPDYGEIVLDHYQFQALG